MEGKKNYFAEMKAVKVQTEKIQDLSYLPWADARDELKTRFPEAEKVWHTNEKGTLGFVDEFGAYAKVSLLIPEFGEITTFLPIQSYTNDPMKREAYSYERYDRKAKKTVTVNVPALDANAINKAYQRCQVKAIAELTGIGLYVFRGEDLPEGEEKPPKVEPPKKPEPPKNDIDVTVKESLPALRFIDFLTKFDQHPEAKEKAKTYESFGEFMNMLKTKYLVLEETKKPLEDWFLDLKK